MKQVSIFADSNSFSYRNIQKTAADMKDLNTVTPSFDISGGIFAMLYTVNFLIAAHLYGLDQLTAPLASLPDFAGFSPHINILEFLCTLYFIRLAGYILCTFMLLSLSDALKSTISALMVCAGLFAGPALLSVMSVSFFNKFSLNAMLIGTILFKENAWAAGIQVAVPVLFGTTSAVLLYRRFCKNHLYSYRAGPLTQTEAV